MKTIIAPTDFSTVSLNAVNYAADMAVALKAELVLLHVVPIPMTVAEVPLTEYEYEEMREEAQQELVVLKNQLFLRTENKINIHLKLSVGSVEHELEQECNYKKPFAVVMGTKGESLAKRFLVGSNTVFAVNNLEFPVLVIPQNVFFKPIKKIALASDLKEIKNVSIKKFLRDWLSSFKSTLDIINVSDHDPMKSDALSESISLQNLLSDFEPHFYFIDKANVEEGVSQFVEEQHPDLLVVIPRRHGLFESFFHRSESKHFILHPNIPVLAISE